MVEGIFRNVNQGIINTKINRPDNELVASISRMYSGFILDHLGKTGYLRGIKPLKSGMKICGSAVTCLGSDLSIRRMAIDLSQEGDVLIVANDGIIDYSCFGDGTATRMKNKKMVGCVIDGATRDSGRLIDMEFPTFVKGITPRNYHYPMSAEYGAVNIPVVVAGQIVNPGDIIFGDDDGVIVIALDKARELAGVLDKNLQDELRFRESEIMHKPFNVEEELKEKGYKFF